MRGIPTSCIQYYAKQSNITILDIYNKLYNGEIIKFDLTNDGHKFVCKNNKDNTVSSVSEFTRTTKFTKNIEKVFIQ